VTAIARLVEKLLVVFLDGTKDARMISSIVKFFVLIVLIAGSVVITYLKINYNLSLGPK